FLDFARNDRSRRRRFSEFDAVSFWIHDPAEFAVVVTFPLWVNIDPFALQLRQDFIQILDLQFDHERFLTRREVIGIGRKWSPDGASLRVWIVRFSPFEYRSAFLFTFDAKVNPVPTAQLIRIGCLKENSAYSGNTFQVLVLLISRGWRRCPGRWSGTPARDWTHLENGSLAFSAAFRRQAIEPSVNENHVIDRFRAVPIMPTEAVKALVVVTIGIDHEDSAHVIVATVGGRAVEFV